MSKDKSITTTKDIVEVINLMSQKDKEEEVSPDEYRYVIYARRSTKAKKKQIFSPEQQIKACKKLARTLNLKVLPEPIIEKESASTSDIRPKFDKMLDDMEKGKFEGIIAWHPDRLSRNMKEGGMIIDMLDNNIIKDLKFPSFNFDNDTNGKVMLGISFVLSKQYTDKLSTDVNRAVESDILKGKYLTWRKHGYYKDINHRLQPEPKIYRLLRKAWQMRIDGKTLKEVSEYINRHDYFVRNTVKDKPEPFTMGTTKISSIFKDPIYVGVLKYGEKEAVDLTDIYEFEPLVSVSDFLKVNNYTSFDEAIRKFRPTSNKKYHHILSGRVLCGYCGKPRTPQITPKKLKNGKVRRYYSYRCDNKKCKFYGKGDRGKVLINFAIDLLEDTNFDTEKAYKKYCEEFIKTSKEEKTDLSEQIKYLNRKLQMKKEEKENTKDLMKREQLSKNSLQEFDDELNSIKEQVHQIEQTISNCKQKREKLDNTILSYPKFLELFKEMPSILKKRTSLKSKNEILTEIFLNCTIKDKKILSYKLKSPFDELLINKEFLDGGPSGT